MKRVLLILLWATALAACPQINSDAGRFHCDAGADCGAGYECWPHFTGGGRCFSVGECVEPEVCDGVDQNCDGQVDESFPEHGQPCTTATPGVCADGHQQCPEGAIICASLQSPMAETCNSLDDDCDGLTDEDFNLSSDALNCGHCLFACDAGMACQTSQCVPTP